MPSLTVHTVRFYNLLYIIYDPVWNERRKSRMLLTRRALDRDRRLRRARGPARTADILGRSTGSN